MTPRGFTAARIVALVLVGLAVLGLAWIRVIAWDRQARDRYASDETLEAHPSLS